jgi:hypothetical protein
VVSTQSTTRYIIKVFFFFFFFDWKAQAQCGSSRALSAGSVGTNSAST